MVEYDLIVVGAGPGGTSAAQTVAKQGYRVLLLEKSSLPRYKPCGGAVSSKAQKLLDWPLQSISKNSISKANVFMLGNHVLDADLGSSFIHLVDRAEFDWKLVQFASGKGVKVAQNEEFISLEKKKGSVVVKTHHNTYKSFFIVGADGPLSTVRKQLGINYKPALGITIEGEYYSGQRSNWNDSVIVDVARPENAKGYNWIFPKGDTVSIGLGTSLPKLLHLKGLLYQYLKDRESSHLKPFNVTGHPLPADGAVQKLLHSELGVLVGDAAGLVDPLTGEGIYYAILSGKIAGEEIVRALRLNSRNLANYSHRINHEITREFKRAAALSHIVYSYPQLFAKMLSADPDFGREVLSVVYGDGKYGGLLFRLSTGTLFKTIIKTVQQQWKA